MIILSEAIIGNKLIERNDKLNIYNPSTGDIIDTIPLLGQNDIKEAIDIASEAFNHYSITPIIDRKKLLLKTANLIYNNKEELAKLMALETGRPINSSRAEIERTGAIFESCAWEIHNVVKGEFIQFNSFEYPKGNENRIGITVREPLGVIASITPFNFPGASFAHKVGPALAMGNTVVHKPTQYAPLLQIALGKLLLKAGFPPGTINIVTGNSSMIGKEFTSNPLIKLITFTGSSKVGLSLASEGIKHGIKSIMELGGSDAQIILDDADISYAVEKATFGRYDYSGQFCNSTKRLIVSNKIIDKVISYIKNRLSQLKVGNALNESTDIGPLISNDSINNMKLFLDDALKNGSQILYQGKTPTETGYFFPPTLVMVNNNKSKILNEEVFGPILPIISTQNDEETIQIVNSSKYGLDAAIFSKNFDRAYKMARQLNVGTVLINDTTRLRWDNVAFGGTKFSGIGRESIKDTMLEMSEQKVIEYTVR